MSELKRTQLYDVHVAAGATMVDFGGWEMPIQYPSGIIAEHLYTRQVCSLFDVSHMGRLLIEGPQRKEFLQHVLTSNVSALDLNMAQYCIIPNENGGAVDDAYLYLFQEDSYLLVVNAANIDKDLEHLNRALSGFDCTITNISDQWASIAVQGPKSKEMLMTLSGGESPTKEPTKNSLGTVSLEGRQARIAKTGYTGEPLGYEVYVRSEDAVWLWNRLVELGAPPFARPLLYGEQEEVRTVAGGDRTGKALTLLHKAIENHVWRQEQCVNLIPSENTPSRAVRLLSGSDPACRYAEHKKILAFYEKEVFYYQGTKFIDQVERMLAEEMRAYFGCTEVETRTLSGQMSNMAVFSALMDWKNRFDRKNEAKRLGYVMNNHIIKGGHLSAQPMGALHDYIAVDPVTEKPAVVNFPVCRDNPYKMDVEETKKLIDRYRPELIIFGKSMVLHKEPVAQIRQFVDEQKIPTTIMYDMAHVLGLIGDHFQNPFQEGAEIVTGSTHKTFFGPQRGVIGVNYKEEDLKYGLWKTIESRTFPGSVSNHHLGTQLGMLMAAYEMNQFRDAYQSAIIRNAKSFARSLKSYGLDVVGDPAIDYTETHQVIVSVGYGEGAEIAERLEQNNVIVNYQATPDEEGFTASGALRMGVSEMTRFGFEEKDFDQLASLMADCILRGREIKGDVERLRASHTEMRYCFDDAAINDALEQLAGKLDI